MLFIYSTTISNIKYTYYVVSAGSTLGSTIKLIIMYISIDFGFAILPYKLCSFRLIGLLYPYKSCFVCGYETAF